MLIDGKRALAYIVRVGDITQIEGADNIELATIGGWSVIIKKNEFKIGDKAVFFEIDSRVPDDDDRFKFLESKHYKIKTMKLNRFKVWSEGLLMPVSEFPELGDPEVNTDVTEILGIKYCVAEDNERKQPSISYNDKEIIKANQKFFNLPLVKILMRYKSTREILLHYYGTKNRKQCQFPEFIHKTDEERCENMPWVLNDGIEYLATEKLDGTSCTYALRRISPRSIFGKEKFEYYVCSRNRRIVGDKNIYWELSHKYNIQDHLQEFLDKNKSEKWVCIQGEGVGFVQGNPLKLKENDLYLFNFITSIGGRMPSLEGKMIAETWGMKWVPLLGTVSMPKTMDELKELADGKSVVNNNVIREGIVYRSLDGKRSFKNVSREYLIKSKKK